MSDQLTQTLVTDSAVATETIGERIGERLRGGEVIELVSDLGGGKTTFVRGLARGMGSADRVASPTFTISREYATPKGRLYHFDFYRLHEAGIVADELAEIAHDPTAVVVVEWGDIVRDVLAREKLTVHIRSTSEDTRELTFTYPASLAYLLAEKEQ